jgi:hypothetical protein
MVECSLDVALLVDDDPPEGCLYIVEHTLTGEAMAGLKEGWKEEREGR